MGTGCKAGKAPLETWSVQETRSPGAPKKLLYTLEWWLKLYLGFTSLQYLNPRPRVVSLGEIWAFYILNGKPLPGTKAFSQMEFADRDPMAAPFESQMGSAGMGSGFSKPEMGSWFRKLQMSSRFSKPQMGRGFKKPQTGRGFNRPQISKMGSGLSKPQTGSGISKVKMSSGLRKPQMGSGFCKSQMGSGFSKPQISKMESGFKKPQMGSGFCKPQMGSGLRKPQMGRIPFYSRAETSRCPQCPQSPPDSKAQNPQTEFVTKSITFYPLQP